MNILITGGAGFIGANFVHYWVKNHPNDQITVLDKLTYAGNLENLTPVQDKIKFIHGDIADPILVDQVMQEQDVVVHFAAETHVDRSVDNPYVFSQTNTLGTHTLLEAARKYQIKRFHHISTDEVFGDIPLDMDYKFNETTQYKPSSPYSASKAGSDHFVRAYGHTFGLPITISNCSNNFGPYMHPEKFIPRSIIRLLQGKKIPIYSPGNQIRDWLHVEDHCRAIETILIKGQPGETYCIGGMTKEISNMEVARLIIKLLGLTDERIEMVTDRPGHDQKYAVDWSKINKQLGWAPKHSFEDWLRKTINWYVNNRQWWEKMAKDSEQFYQSRGEKVIQNGQYEVTSINQELNHKETSLINHMSAQIENDLKTNFNTNKPMRTEPDYIIETKLPGVFIIERPTFTDDRGFFRETFRKEHIEAKFGQSLDFLQTNHSHSGGGTLRGIHIAPWHKLVTCTRGLVQQIVVDTRPHSPTFGQHISVMMGERNQKAVFLPKDCGNAFLVMSPEADYLYQTTAYWEPGKERNIAYDDPKLNIAWANPKPLLSDKDKTNPTFKELFNE